MSADTNNESLSREKDTRNVPGPCFYHPAVPSDIFGTAGAQIKTSAASFGGDVVAAFDEYSPHTDEQGILMASAWDLRNRLTECERLVSHLLEFHDFTNFPNTEEAAEATRDKTRALLATLPKSEVPA